MGYENYKSLKTMIGKLAERFKISALAEQRIIDFNNSRNIMIRWDIPFDHNKNNAKSYDSIEVTREEIMHIVHNRFKNDIDESEMKAAEGLDELRKFFN